MPTGLGKTSVLHCWAYALAAHAQRGARTLPLRLFFVVDRRLVVDGAFEEASDLAQRLSDDADAAGIVAEVASTLRAFTGSSTPLEVVRMRGGVTWDSRWLPRPDQPAIVVGTVDQFGSRLLFRGYGVSPSMRPIDAALAGIDAWLVVDEAHIAEPLLQTAATAAAHQRLQEREVGLRPLVVTAMSATVAEQTADQPVLRADPDEQTHSMAFPVAASVAARRLNASKPVTLVDLSFLERPARNAWRRQAAQLGQELAALALSLEPEARVIGLVANTIVTARAAFTELAARGEQAILLTGRVRGYERDRILERWLPLIRVGSGREMAGRLYVVATQTIEVGANVDFDALVTECAPLPALVQRFGRVNRIGERPAYRSLIVHAGFSHDDDPIYGSATSATWDYLRKRSSNAPEVVARTGGRLDAVGEPGLDFGLRPARTMSDEAPVDVRPSAPFTPLALGAHFERWAASNPAPQPDQDVGPFLHGVDRVVPEVSVAWRAAPPGGADDIERWQEWLNLVPPVEWEFVSVPVWEAKALLAGTPAAPLGDVEGQLAPAESAAPGPGLPGDLLGVVYRGADEAPTPVFVPTDVNAGDRIVLRCTVGGHDDWGWTGTQLRPGERPVPDVGDFAPTRRRGVLRLAAAVLETLLPVDQAERLAPALALVDADDPATSVALALEAIADLVPGDPALQARLLSARTWVPYEVSGLDEAGRPVFLLSEPRAHSGGADTQSDEDSTSTSQSGEQVSLRRHSEEVAATARQFAEHAGLPAPLVAAVELAARLHDIGKADPRFQVVLHDGDSVSARAALELLAKSGRDPRDPLARRARALSGLPLGFRHEAVSARLFDALTGVFPDLAAEVDAELVRHLIASHHGRSRPLLPPVLDATAPDVTFTLDGVTVSVAGAQRQVDWSQPARFEALCGRYGWWGLAYLEALVRLADMLCSEEGS